MRNILFIGIFLLLSCARESKIKVSMLIGADPGGGWKQIEQEFEKQNPDIDVNIIEGPSATDTREDMYASAFIAKDATYDVVYMDIIWVPKFAKAGWIIPLDDKLSEEKDESKGSHLPGGSKVQGVKSSRGQGVEGSGREREFLPGDIAGSKYKGKIYRIPLQSDAGILYYRKDILEKAGLEPPETWEELVNIARKLQNPPDLWGFTFQGDQYEGLICNFLELVWGAGGKIMDAEGNIQVDSKECLSALKWMASLVGEISPPGVTTYQEEESRHIFQEGRCIFHRNWPYVWTLAQKEESPIKGKIGIIPMVHKKGYESAATQGGWGLGISKFSKHLKEAWKFIEFATSTEGQKVLHFKNGYIPTRHELFKDPEILEKSPHYEQLYEIQLKARPRPVHPRYSEISDALQVEIHSAITGIKPPEQALKDAQKKIRSILD